MARILHLPHPSCFLRCPSQATPKISATPSAANSRFRNTFESSAVIVHDPWLRRPSQIVSRCTLRFDHKTGLKDRVVARNIENLSIVIPTSRMITSAALSGGAFLNCFPGAKNWALRLQIHPIFQNSAKSFSTLILWAVMLQLGNGASIPSLQVNYPLEKLNLLSVNRCQDLHWSVLL